MIIDNTYPEDLLMDSYSSQEDLENVSFIFKI